MPAGIRTAGGSVRSSIARQPEMRVALTFKGVGAAPPRCAAGPGRPGSTAFGSSSQSQV